MRGAWGGHCGSLSHIIVTGNEISPCFYVCLLADVLVLGMGTKVKKVDPAILSYLHRKGISVEIQDTVRRDWSLVRCTARYVTCTCSSPFPPSPMHVPHSTSSLTREDRQGQPSSLLTTCRHDNHS